jgi:hypothetical protein
MRFYILSAMAVAGLAFGADTSSASAGAVTFNKDVLPILQTNCQSCHRPGQIAPMSLLTYESARPWAKVMKAAVMTRKMPPWGADSKYGHFSNDRSLTQRDIDTIAKWADTGAPAGDPKDAPKPVEWPSAGWQIKPDVIVEGPVYDVPASGIVEWTWSVIPSPFKEDTWVTSVEVRPTQPQVTHHMCLAYGPHREGTIYGKFFWQNKARDAKGDEINDRKGQGGVTTQPAANTVGGILAGTGGIEECYEPGRQPADFRPYGAAKLIRKGSDIAINYHFTPNGTAVKANVQIGFTIAKEPPKERYYAMSGSGPQDHETFAIPPNDPDWVSPPLDIEFEHDAKLVGLMPHMHLRGKDMSFELQYPDGRKEMILDVPRYDFNWQIWYDTSINVPKGTIMHVVAHYDNSAKNRFNPDPSKVVYYGDMTWDEMMFPSWGVVVDDLSLKPKDVAKKVSRSEPVAKSQVSEPRP